MTRYPLTLRKKSLAALIELLLLHTRLEGWSVLVTLALCVILTGCNSGTERIVHINVPDGYRGEIKLIVSENGDPKVQSEHIERQTKNHSLVYRYKVPKDGTLIIPSWEPFDSWHKVEASYRGNGKLPVWGYDGASEDTVYLFEAGGRHTSSSSSTDERALLFFVGTRREYENHRGWDRGAGSSPDE